VLEWRLPSRCSRQQIATLIEHRFQGKMEY
jgi:hypothetical protein